MKVSKSVTYWHGISINIKIKYISALSMGKIKFSLA